MLTGILILFFFIVKLRNVKKKPNRDSNRVARVPVNCTKCIYLINFLRRKGMRRRECGI